MSMRWPIAIYRIAERSMEPTLREGDYIIACNLLKIDEGQIVVAEHPTRRIPIVKRVSGISSGSVFLSGDNPKESEDSRVFGPIAKDKVFGKVIMRI